MGKERALDEGYFRAPRLSTDHSTLEHDGRKMWECCNAESRLRYLSGRPNACINDSHRSCATIRRASLGRIVQDEHEHFSPRPLTEFASASSPARGAFCSEIRACVIGCGCRHWSPSGKTLVGRALRALVGCGKRPKVAIVACVRKVARRDLQRRAQPAPPLCPAWPQLDKSSRCRRVDREYEAFLTGRSKNGRAVRSQSRNELSSEAARNQSCGRNRWQIRLLHIAIVFSHPAGRCATLDDARGGSVAVS